MTMVDTATAQKEGMKQSVRYGLMTALRPFDVPVWDGACELHMTDGVLIEGAPLRAQTDTIATRHEGAVRVLTIAGGTRGTVKIRRLVEGASAMHLTLHVEENCHVSIEDEYCGDSVAHATVVTIAPNSSVTYRILHDLNDMAPAFIHYEARVERASLTWSLCALGGATSQVSILTDAGEKSVVKTNTAIVGTGEQQIDLHLTTRHCGQESSGNMLSRCVLDGRARAITHGLIRIEANAGGSDSYQKSETILLSDAASADAIPNLEINNHNVRCSHGASIGKLDAEKLFYYRSRGVTEEIAKRMITEGFIGTLIPDDWWPRAAAKLGLGVHQDEGEDDA